MMLKLKIIKKTPLLFFLVEGILILTLLMSFFVNYNLYKRLLTVQIDPTATWFNPVVPTNISNNVKTLFIGDSRVSQWKNQLPFKDSIAYGFSGFTSEQIKLSLSLITMSDNIDDVFIQVGINDLKSISFFEDKSESIQKHVFDNIQAISEFFVLRNIKVHVLTIIPSKTIGYPRKLIWSDLIDANIRIINNKLINLKSPSFEVIDVSSSFVDADYLFKDSLHLNSKGYELLNKIINSNIKY